MGAALTLWIGAAAVMACVVLLGTALLSDTGRGTSAAPTDLRQVLLRQRARKRLLGPVMGRAADAMHALTPKGAIERLDHKIDIAGARASWTVDRLVGTKVIPVSYTHLRAHET